MSRRKFRTVILCEDQQHARFGRLLLELLGFQGIREKKMRVEAVGGYARVRTNYPREVAAKRQLGENVVVVVFVDADTRTIADENGRLVCDPPREAEDAIVHFVPRRNIESWVAALRGEAVDETTDYSGRRDLDVQKSDVEAFLSGCERGTHALESLVNACSELQRLRRLDD